MTIPKRILCTISSLLSVREIIYSTGLIQPLFGTNKNRRSGFRTLLCMLAWNADSGRCSGAVSAHHNQGPNIRGWVAKCPMRNYDLGSMQWLWCWRCKCEMPMLDEQGFAEIAPLHRLGMQSVKEYRAETGAPIAQVPLARRFEAMLTHPQKREIVRVMS